MLASRVVAMADLHVLEQPCSLWRASIGSCRILNHTPAKGISLIPFNLVLCARNVCTTPLHHPKCIGREMDEGGPQFLRTNPSGLVTMQAGLIARAFLLCSLWRLPSRFCILDLVYRKKQADVWPTEVSCQLHLHWGALTR